jgi:hypothetical protein
MNVPLIHELMRSGNHPNFVDMVEFLSDVLNIDIITDPNRNPAPLGLSLYPTMSSGSLQTKSQPAPFSGISWTLGSARI